jgi:hypothetical protein
MGSETQGADDLAVALDPVPMLEDQELPLSAFGTFPRGAEEGTAIVAARMKL